MKFKKQYLLVLILILCCGCEKWNKKWDIEDAKVYKVLTSCFTQDEAKIIGSIKTALKEYRFKIDKIEKGHIQTKWKNSSLPSSRMGSGTYERSRIDIFILGMECKRIVVRIEVNSFQEKRSDEDKVKHFVFQYDNKLETDIMNLIYNNLKGSVQAQPRPDIKDIPLDWEN